MFKLYLIFLSFALAISACAAQNQRSPSENDSDTDSDADSDGDSDVDSDSDGDGDSDSNADSDTEDDECAEIDHSINPTPINLLILLDRSRSMVLNTIKKDTFADITADAINKVVSTYDSKGVVNFGLAVFPSISCTCTDEDQDPENDKCTDDPLTEYGCTPAQASDSPIVPISNKNAKEIEKSLNNIGTCGGTPISQSLVWANSYLSSLPKDLADYPTFVLLATDGAPNCNHWGPTPITEKNCQCTLPNKEECTHRYQCLDDIATFNWAANLYNSGVKTFVVGVGNDLSSWEKMMDNIASYGGTGHYYPATDPSSLQSAIEEILSGLMPCSFEVEWEEVPDTGPNGDVDKACDKVTVYAIPDLKNPDDKVELPYSADCDNAGGWQWKELPDVSFEDLDDYGISECLTIELCDGACNDLRSEKYDSISASFGCAPDIIK